jgi:integrase
MYGGTREEVRRKLALALAGRETGSLPDAHGRGFGAFLDEWLETTRPSIADATYRGYEVHVRVHIKPAFRSRPLERLEPAELQTFLNRKLVSGLSAKSVRNLRATLRTALNQAIRWGYVHRNVAELTDGPRVEKFEIQPLTPSEARRFLSCLKGHRLEAYYSVALAIGLRRNEALAG